MSLVFDRERVGAWAAARIPYVDTWGAWYQAIGLERDGEIVAACVYTDQIGTGITMNVAIDCGGKWMTREALRAVFRYPFRQLGCRRVTALIAAHNAASRRITEKLGFRQEGVLRAAVPGDDLIVYGMLREECKLA